MRLLGEMERGLWKTDLGAPLNFTTVARVSGGITEGELRAALPALRARHPHLRARIVEDGNEVWLRDDYVPPLSLRVARGEGASWVREIEHEINTHVLPNPGPLARFVLVEQDGESWVLATLHHSVGDGMSGAFLVRDWIAAASGRRLAPLEDPGPLEPRIPASVRSASLLPNLVRMGLVDVRQRLAGRVVKLKAGRAAFAYERRTRVFHRLLDVATGVRVLDAARNEKTTVHGALSAALILGLLDHAGVAKGRIEFGSPIDLRKRLEPPLADELGFYISMIAHREVVRASADFWDLARSIRRNIEREKARGTDLAMLGLLSAGMALLGRDRLEPRALIRRWETNVFTSTGLTNLGRLPIDAQQGRFRIETCGFAACPSALGDFVSTATSMHGHIHWNFGWPDVISEAAAVALVDGIVERLTRAL